MTRQVAFTVDLEPDCPPYLHGFRGVEQGMPALLEVLDALAVRGTFFTTGEVAQRYPGTVRALLAAGHELACHGMTHRSFARMSPGEARDEIAESSAVLRAFGAPVDSFRAPYLQLPERFVPLLAEHGYRTDSSLAKHKPGHWWRLLRSRRKASAEAGELPLAKGKLGEVRRVPASTTSSVLRLPRGVWRAHAALLRTPVVLFVHPWEFVDLTRERIRWDCRAGTGAPALRAVERVLRELRDDGARFVRMREVAA